MKNFNLPPGCSISDINPPSCPICEGSGELERSHKNSEGLIKIYYVPCQECNPQVVDLNYIPIDGNEEIESCSDSKQYLIQDAADVALITCFIITGGATIGILGYFLYIMLTQ